MTEESAFCKLIQNALALGDLAVEFDPKHNPKYIPKTQSYRSSKEAIIQFPLGFRKIFIKGDTQSEIENVVRAIKIRHALLIFAHEFGHHFTDNPTYDDALKRCLARPLLSRSLKDIYVVLKEECEAWHNGFKKIKEVNGNISSYARFLALKHVISYLFALCLPRKTPTPNSFK